MAVQTMKDGPLYFRIKEDLKKRIKNGEFQAGDILPTEMSLCEQYEASRVTVRRSINELIDEQILERGYGKSATVRGEAVPRNLNYLTGLHEELTSRGIKCSSFVLSCENMEPSDEIREKLGLKSGEKVLRMERLRYANGKALCYQIFYVPEKICPTIDASRVSNESLYAIIENTYGVKIKDATQTISAIMSNYRISALLELPEQTCMLKVCRIAMDENDACVEYSESYYVSTRYALNMTLKR